MWVVNNHKVILIHIPCFSQPYSVLKSRFYAVFKNYSQINTPYGGYDGFSLYYL